MAFMPPPLVNEDGWIDADLLSPNVILYRNIEAEEALYTYEALGHVPTVAIVDVKGGVKKTTTAVHTAFGLHRMPKGRRKTRKILIGDCDQYHSVADWQARAAENGDPWPEEIVVVSSGGDNFHHELIDAVAEHKPDHLVIDTPPNDEDAALRALLGADVLLMPTGPFDMDIRRLSYGIKAGGRVLQLRKGYLEALAVLTGCKLGTKIYKDARKDLIASGISFVNSPVRDLVQHAHAFGTSLPNLNDYDFVTYDLSNLFDKIAKR